MSLAIFTIKSVLPCLILYLIYGVTYWLYLSPISKFPGRKLAALILWYEFYYDVIKRGSYIWEIKKMHEKYGKSCSLLPDTS